MVGFAFLGGGQPILDGQPVGHWFDEGMGLGLIIVIIVVIFVWRKGRRDQRELREIFDRREED